MTLVGRRGGKGFPRQWMREGILAPAVICERGGLLVKV